MVAMRGRQEIPDGVDEYHSYYDDGVDIHFTWRAVIVGSALGCIVSASNMYLGLKAGWVFGASIFGAILGYSILEPLSRLGGAFGGPFGIKENCTVQTAATAAGGLASGFIAGVPALFRLNLMPPLNECVGIFFMWTMASAFLGMFFAVPLRSYYILKKKLVFPSCTASAHTIRALHAQGGAEAQIRWVLWPFFWSFLLKATSFFVPLVVELHPVYWLSVLFKSQALQVVDTTWNWKIQISTAFIGAGMLAGPAVALSFFGGTLLAWGIIGPTLFYFDTDVLHDIPFGFAPHGTRVQVWNLWVGIVIMVVASFTELGFQYSYIWRGLRGGAEQLYNGICYLFPQLTALEVEQEYDPVKEEHRVPIWMWASGLSLALALTLFVLCFHFNISLGMSVLAVVLGFVFSFISCQSAGDIDLNPAGAVAKTSQIVFSVFPAGNPHLFKTQNLFAGIVASSCASQAVDMVGDLKTGHLLKASPLSQFYAQIIGSAAGIVVSVILFMLFATAYPCILVESESCPFGAPAVVAWTGVTKFLTSDVIDTIPTSCRVACLMAGVLTFIVIFLKNTLLVAYARSIPNLNAIALAFVNPAPYIPMACFIGYLTSLLWKRYYPYQWNIIDHSLASGLIAGEGIAGAFHALLHAIGIDQQTVALGFGCPGNNPMSC